MHIQSYPKRKYIALITLLLLLIVDILQVVLYFQVKAQLTSPVIPQSAITEIAGRYLQLAGILFGCFIIAGICYRYSKYAIAIIICVVAILMPRYYVGL